jgi:hypothetical protein
MKKITGLILLLFVFAFPAWAQFDVPRPALLTPEETRLLNAFRRDPEPFRRILYAANQPEAVPVAPMEAEPGAYAVGGPRDLIDVTIDGGQIAFYGKPRDYEPLSFRIARGQETYVIFRRTDSITETRVKVAFRSDGLHFDVPEPYGGTEAFERGFIVIPEDARWEQGDAIAAPGRITAARSLSRAVNINFHIRYAFSPPARQKR